ncbi:hypothetical protein BKA64DRAFT_125401 [Cadophora sp. MPI-SDFR-AT-0126]|nr:hypothetical protein BKA64DRAFT_125401 [Leotiomycetes sp. MPI-SDFR-AT-0126]
MQLSYFKASRWALATPLARLALLQEVEASARETISKQPVTDISHITAWREAYKGFGAKPKKERNSLESLMRRVEGSLPGVNRLTDIYNAISIKHQIPLGGEDLESLSGFWGCD